MNEQEKWENVIKGLECCSVPAKNRYCDSCPIGFEDGCRLNLKRAALALLKMQEPVKPHMDYDGHDVWLCGNCHRKIFHPSHTEADNDEKNYHKFCFYCGRALKWK